MVDLKSEKTIESLQARGSLALPAPLALLFIALLSPGFERLPLRLSSSTRHQVGAILLSFARGQS